MDFPKLLSETSQQGGTEIHLKIGLPPLVRQNKFLKRLKYPALTGADLETLIKNLLSPEDRKRYVADRFFEANFFGQSPANFRLNLFQAQGQTMAIVRLIRPAVPRFEEIGLPEPLGAFVGAKKGLVILAGPARSGISTSLAAFVERMNQSQSAHILLLEDPIEFSFKQQRARISQRQFNRDFYSVESAIIFAKRMDVDALVIGDLKREIPFRSILDHVAGGHLVLLTMQTLGIVNTLEKILLSFPERDRDFAGSVLAANLLAICSQALLPGSTGRDQHPVHELLIINPTIAGIIQKGRVAQVESNINSAGPGSCLFETSANKLIRTADISKATIENFLAQYRGTKT